jgi:hypothetical protein
MAMATQTKQQVTMPGTTQYTAYETRTEETRYVSRISPELAQAAWYTEGLLGIGAVTMAVLSLSGVAPMTLLPIAGFATGLAMLFAGISAAMYYPRVVRQDRGLRHRMLFDAMTIELLGGAAGIVLGFIALYGMAWMTLMPVAAMALGVAAIWSSTSTARRMFLAIETSGESIGQRTVAHEVIHNVMGFQILLGSTAATLGILAVIGLSALWLTSVAMLCLGTWAVLSGTSSIRRALTHETRE